MDPIPAKSSSYRAHGIVSIRLTECRWNLVQTVGTVRSKRKTMAGNDVKVPGKVCVLLRVLQPVITYLSIWYAPCIQRF